MDSFGVSSTTDGRGVGAVEALSVREVVIALDEVVVALPSPPLVVLPVADAEGGVFASCTALALRRHTPAAPTTDNMSITLHSDKPTPMKTHHQAVPAIKKVHPRTLSSKLPVSKLSAASSRAYACRGRANSSCGELIPLLIRKPGGQDQVWQARCGENVPPTPHRIMGTKYRLLGMAKTLPVAGPSGNSRP